MNFRKIFEQIELFAKQICSMRDKSDDAETTAEVRKHENVTENVR